MGATDAFAPIVAPMSLTDTRIKAAKPAEKIYKIYNADGFHRPYIHKKEK